MDGAPPLLRPAAPVGGVRLGLAAMRTRFELVLADDGDPARLRAAGEEALAEIADVEAWLSPHRADSALARVNAGAAQAAVTVDGRMLGFLRAARALAAASGGACDPTAGALVGCWREALADGRVPDAAAIAAARAACGMELVICDEAGGSVRFAHPEMRLDPGALGKGVALDRAAAILRDHGVGRALLHGGTSSVVGIGDPGWTIAIRHPLNAEEIIATTTLRDATLSVSAGHGRATTVDGRSYGHVIDPRSGWPVAGNLLAAVTHPQATVSEGLSTALLVLGEDGLAELARRFPEAAFLLVRKADEAVEVISRGDGFAMSSVA
jgi:thiamine biosynthesis lipoprotein